MSQHKGTRGDPPGPAVEVRLDIEEGEPLRGALRVEGNETAHTFDGWLELMAAINAARAPRDA